MPLPGHDFSARFLGELRFPHPSRHGQLSGPRYFGGEPGRPMDGRRQERTARRQATASLLAMVNQKRRPGRAACDDDDGGNRALSLSRSSSECPKFVCKLRTAAWCQATGNLLRDSALLGATSHAAVRSQLRIPSLTPSQLIRPSASFGLVGRSCSISTRLRSPLAHSSRREWCRIPRLWALFASGSRPLEGVRCRVLTWNAACLRPVDLAKAEAVRRECRRCADLRRHHEAADAESVAIRVVSGWPSRVPRLRLAASPRARRDGRVVPRGCSCREHSRR